MIKAAFFDVDWTMYDHSEKKWSESGIEAIKKLKRRGVKVFVCSARPYDSQKLFGVFDLGIKWDGYIASAGAIAVVGNKTIQKQLMNKRDAYAICSKMKKLGRALEVVTPKGRFMVGTPDEYVDSYNAIYHYITPKIRPYRGEETTGLLLFMPEENDEEVRSVCSDLAWFRFHPAAVDVSGVEHRKGDAIKCVLDYLGLRKEETISFGDDFQDISMGEATGIFVCMGNGRDEVKKMADYVTSAVGDGGIERALEYFKLI